MNKYQKRKNKLKKYKIFLSDDKMKEILDSDKQYNNFSKLMNVFEDITKKLYKFK